MVPCVVVHGLTRLEGFELWEENLSGGSGLSDSGTVGVMADCGFDGVCFRFPAKHTSRWVCALPGCDENCVYLTMSFLTTVDWVVFTLTK